ncbi:MAG: multiple sugar transport system substrate-binding protein [Abditibacteriota bacterium]|nr:multiple sugar transport system substrate-binding protein [Abditibacteriota bacterium]
MQRIKLVFSVVLALVIVGVLVFGPRPGADRPKNRVVVSYWEKWTGNEAEQMKQIVTDFNNTVGAEKGIYVEYLSMSNVNQKTLVATAAGVPPDIAGLWDTQVAQFAAINALQPLDELAAVHGINEEYYKRVYWEGCRYNGKLWALVSTPAAVALHYNKRIFKESASKLRAAGLDPDRAPRTLDELDHYAEVLDVFDNRKRVERAGYLPMEPGWFLPHTSYWFGGGLFNPKTQKFTLTDPKVLRAYEWVQSYSKRMGKASLTEFRSGMGGFNSAQNPFLVGTVVMEQQGPWMANYIEDLKPKMNRWVMSKEEEKRLPTVEQRRANYEWAVAPFPSAVSGQENVTYAGFDVLMIPRGARHPKEAFEFIAYVNQQGPMEKLCSLHCKNSPLREVSEEFIRNHPNPYIDVFETLSASPNAHGIPPVPIWPEVNEELGVAVQKVYLLEATPEAALRESQARLQEKYDRFRATQLKRENQDKVAQTR